MWIAQSLDAEHRVDVWSLDFGEHGAVGDVLVLVVGGIVAGCEYV